MNSIRIRAVAITAVVVLAAGASRAAERDVQDWLARPLLATNQALQEAQTYAARRVPAVPNPADWPRESVKMRQDALDRVMLPGRAASWRSAPAKIEWQETITLPGYRIRKVRYEVLPRLWVPALLYEPAQIAGRQPAVLYFNGHDPAGKSSPTSQTVCINLARRGVTVLNVEWFGTGQLNAPGYDHGRLNQLDLVGVGGISPFYLAMVRALDLLLAQPAVDPQRVAAAGFDGGGWQALLLGALDPRVKLVSAAAGYGSLYSSLKTPLDLGDSENLAHDFWTVGDYLHFTLLVSPRPLLLTYVASDPVRFAASPTLNPLISVAGAFYKAQGAETNFHFFVGDESAGHTYDRASREKFYRIIGDYFFPGDAGWRGGEMAVETELRGAGDLNVPLPAGGETFHTLAESAAAKLPLEPDVPGRASRLGRWQDQQRALLRDLVRAKEYPVKAVEAARDTTNGVTGAQWKLSLGSGRTDWTVPAVELARGNAKATAVVIADAGRKSAGAEIEALLKSGLRVIAMDPSGFGESLPAVGGGQFPLLISALGDRPLGVQSGQVAAVARWAEGQFQSGPVVLVSVGPRTSLIALVAAGLEESAIGGLELHHGWNSLKEILKADWTVDQAPEAFCPGLLEQFDVPQLEALVKPRPVVRRNAK